ncbi:TspO/MBR family protein [Aestuariibaculum suncheonense]|uniref:Tryptophan-rich sensory protein n=1 Tax=Aestuariibaculum suncheonense TaxID=1028745 RepID=A0A8J6QGR3_9FLAO|nr:TspO/MBR family protein [Aestuariibaculum suncheonense]MBD0835206.1 tryptophan-rich sensory protein [Aestuariibaculum suncheonense]
MKILKYFLGFLIVNYGALALGAWLMQNGPQSEWYLNLNKAPWTPPGWVFGTAWSMIMLCFSVYMAFLWPSDSSKKVKSLFTVQFLLNVGWNFVFFNQHMAGLGLLVILLLTAVVCVFQYDYRKVLGLKSLLITPYMLWLFIANSLNLYIWLYN